MSVRAVSTQVRTRSGRLGPPIRRRALWRNIWHIASLLVSLMMVTCLVSRLSILRPWRPIAVGIWLMCDRRVGVLGGVGRVGRSPESVDHRLLGLVRIWPHTLLHWRAWRHSQWSWLDRVGSRICAMLESLDSWRWGPHRVQEVTLRIVLRSRDVLSVLRPRFCGRLPEIKPESVLLAQVYLSTPASDCWRSVELSPLVLRVGVKEWIAHLRHAIGTI
jgi:hypothetical protein